MNRTQIQFERSQLKKLKVIAQRESIAVSALVRRAVDAYLGEVSELDSKARALTAIGRFHSGHRDGAIGHDDALIDAFANADE
jgi:hypothetical protein